VDLTAYIVLVMLWGPGEGGGGLVLL
jgi:hypothetical protein